jgi:hypothetical protein
MNIVPRTEIWAAARRRLADVVPETILTTCDKQSLEAATTTLSDYVAKELDDKSAIATQILSVVGRLMAIDRCVLSAVKSLNVLYLYCNTNETRQRIRVC